MKALKFYPARLKKATVESFKVLYHDDANIILFQSINTIVRPKNMYVIIEFFNGPERIEHFIMPFEKFEERVQHSDPFGYVYPPGLFVHIGFCVKRGDLYLKLSDHTVNFADVEDFEVELTCPVCFKQMEEVA